MHARLLGHVQRKFISDTLGSKVKQSSLRFTKGLRLLTYYKGKLFKNKTKQKPQSSQFCLPQFPS